MKIYLGTIDIPYSDADGITTGDVAEILEEKYGLLGDGFVPNHIDEMATLMAESFQGAIEAMVVGVKIEPFNEACSEIAASMKRFLTTQEAERVGLPNVPTGAALAGVNKRLKLGHGPRRPSFIDSSEMVSSFTCWTDADGDIPPAEPAP